jgi:hypothetical protein
MTLTSMDLIVIGSIIGATTSLTTFITLVFFRAMERRKKMRLMEEFLMHMHDKMETDEKFVSIINQLKQEDDNQ